MEEAKRDLETAELERQKKFEDAIGHKNIMVGMSSDQVRRSWGSPERINSSGGISGSHEQWIYGDDYVYFDADKLTSWQSRR
jgi:hypothetical protein